MSLSSDHKTTILNAIRDIQDYPKPGILFKDITTLLNNPEAMKVLLDHLEARYCEMEIDYIAGAESRGFLFGMPLADRLNVGFVPIRKPGKLPSTTISEKYSLEYGFDEVQMHIDAFCGNKGARVLFIDDLIATGGTANASINLINKAGGECIEACFIIELLFLKGRDVIENAPVYSVLEID